MTFLLDYALEYCPHGDLYSLLEKIGRISDMKVLAFYMAQLITTVEFIHSKNILHRDIKPENLLLDAKLLVTSHLSPITGEDTYIIALNLLHSTHSPY